MFVWEWWSPRLKNERSTAKTASVQEEIFDLLECRWWICVCETVRKKVDRFEGCIPDDQVRTIGPCDNGERGTYERAMGYFFGAGPHERCSFR
jgi:hypothetical protein